MSSISPLEPCVVCGGTEPHLTDEDYWHCDNKAFAEMLEEVNAIRDDVLLGQRRAKAPAPRRSPEEGPQEDEAPG